MDLPPLSEEELWDLILDAEERMDRRERRFWECVRIDPQRWECPYWGDSVGGFWAVGLIGTTVIWYNEIEDGFNQSPYKRYGTIGDYRCNQDNLAETVGALLDSLESGIGPGYFGPPEPL